MNEPSYDEFRALLEGRLDAADAAHLRARLAKDEVLASEFAAYSEVHAFTAPALAVAAVPASRASFERVDAARRAARMRRLRPWIAAAAGVLVAVGAAAAYRSANAPSEKTTASTPQTPHVEPPPTAPRPVVLKSVRLADAGLAAAMAPLSEPPSQLEDYRPVENGAIRWVASIDGAYAMAKWTGRPVLVWVCMDGCPVCADLSKRAFVDRGVTAATARFVPLRVEIRVAPPELQKRVSDCGAWPYMAAHTAERKEVQGFSGRIEPADLHAGIDASWTKFAATSASAAPTRDPPSWETVNELAAKLPSAADAWKAGRVAEAWAAWDDAAKRGGATPFADVGAEGVRRVAASAAAALEDARKKASSDDADVKRAGARSLSEAAERFRGTPYGTDLAEVEKALRATGRFPTLVEAAK